MEVIKEESVSVGVQDQRSGMITSASAQRWVSSKSLGVV